MRLTELFESDIGRLSMMRLTMFLSFFPASWVIIKNPTETMLGLYLGAYVTGYLGGKFADTALATKQSQVGPMGSGSVSADISITANK